jgi:hypothetical protein
MDATNYQKWLTEKIIPLFHDGMLKMQLYGLIEAYKLRNRQYNGCTWTRGVMASSLSSRLELD